MARFNNNQDSYKINLEINKDEVIKDIREIKKETESIIKNAEYDIKRLRLKRKDILVIKVNGIITNKYKQMIEKKLRKELHRKVIVVDETIENMSVIEK